MSKSVLMIDQGEVFLAVALRAAQAGWTVYYYIEPDGQNNPKLTGKDVHPNIQKVTEWLPLATKVDLVIASQNDKYMDKLDMFKKRGVKAYTASFEACELEVNRAKGMKWLEKRGISVPAWKSFPDLAAVKKYVEENPNRYVIKPGGDCPDKSLSFVAKNVGQLLQQIDIWEARKVDFCGDIIVQEFIPGIEFAAGSWVGPSGFIGYPLETFEHKKLFSGEVGPGTGEQGTIAKYVKKSKLFDELLKPLEKDLVKLGAWTNVDLNCIIAEDGTPYVLEFTMRPGMPIFCMQMYAHKGDPIQWMLDALNGEDSLKVSFETQIGVVLTIPDYPANTQEKKKLSVGLPLYGLNKKNALNFQPQGLMMGEFYDEKGKDKVDGFISTGNYLGVVCETAPTIEQARKKVYKIVKELDISGMQYRDDIGEKVIKALPDLQKLGYASDWEIG